MRVLADAVLATVAGVEHLARLQRLQAHAARTRTGRCLSRFSVLTNAEVNESIYFFPLLFLEETKS